MLAFLNPKIKETEVKHCSNPKSCAVAYPTQERQGLLWVWAESGTQAQQESQLRKPRLIPELESDSDNFFNHLVTTDEYDTYF